MVCADAVLVPFAANPAACSDACAASLHCAGSSFTAKNECFLCGHGSLWESLEQAHTKTAPTGCTFNATTNRRVCITCPGEAGLEAIRGFQSLRIANAMLVLSATCAYIAPAPPDALFGVSTSPLLLPENATVVGPGTLLNPIEIRGANVLVESLYTESAINIRDRNATIRHVRTMVDPGAIKIVERAVGLCTIVNTTGSKAVAGVGHGSATISMSGCDAFPNNISLVLQEARGADRTLQTNLDPSCQSLQIVNLTSLMNVFGRQYEVRFFNDGRYAYAAKPHTFETIIYVFAANLLFATNLYVLIGKEFFDGK